MDYGDVAIVPGLHRAELRGDRGGGRARSSRRASSRCSSAATTPARCPTCGRRGRAGPVAVIDFDSHTDAWDSYFGERYNHGTWMRRAIEEGLVDVGHSIEVGLRGSLYERERLDRAARRARARLPDDRGRVRASGRRRSRRAIRERVGDRPAFISFDIDVVDPAYAPGTGTPEAGGPSARDAAGDRPRADRHRLRRLRRGRGDPGLRPGRPDGDAGGEPGLRDAVARRAPAARPVRPRWTGGR